MKVEDLQDILDFYEKYELSYLTPLVQPMEILMQVDAEEPTKIVLREARDDYE